MDLSPPPTEEKEADVGPIARDLRKLKLIADPPILDESEEASPSDIDQYDRLGNLKITDSGSDAKQFGQVEHFLNFLTGVDFQSNQ